MKEPDFPDKPKAGSVKIPTTIENMECLLQCAGIKVRYNLIKKKDEILIPGHQGTADNLDNVSLAVITSLASKHGLSTGLVPDFVKVVADRNAYNPVADWIRSKSWDGIDRLPAFYATITVQADYPNELKQVLMGKWITSVTAAAIVTGYKGRGVLTLQGGQGIGKTSWVKSLVSDPELRDGVIKVDHHLDGGNKDSVLGAITHFIVEIGELESSFRKDIDRLKGFLTSDSDRVRRPYDKRESEYPRRTVFVATVNGTNFLSDPTGNTRFWTLAVKSLNYNHDIDMQQLYAQLAVEIEGGAQWWLTPEEEAQLEAWNRRHRIVSAIAEKLADFIDPNKVGRAGNPNLTATEMLEAMGFVRPTNMQAKECAAALRELLGEPKRCNGIYRWRVPLKDETNFSGMPVAKRQEAEEVF